MCKHRTENKPAKQPASIHSKREIFIRYILPALIGAVAVITASVITVCSQTCNNGTRGKGEPMGEITHPRKGDVVEQVFVVRGSLSNVDMDQYYWVAIQVGNLLWPKEPRVPSMEGDWEISVLEPVQNRYFSLVLFLVDEKGNNEIENWFKQGRERGHYPGLANIPDGKRLDVVESVMVR